MPFFLYRKKWKRNEEGNSWQIRQGRLTFNYLSAWFWNKEKERRDRYNPVQESTRDLLSDGKPVAIGSQLSAFCGCPLGFGELCPWQHIAGRQRKCLSPAFYGKDILWGGWRGGTHSSVWWSWWHGDSHVRHFSVFLFQSFSPPVYGCNFGLQRHIIFSDLL